MRKLEAEAVNFLWKRKHFDEKVRSGNELGSESVEKELEAEAIFSKSGASGFSNSGTGYNRRGKM